MNSTLALSLQDPHPYENDQILEAFREINHQIKIYYQLRNFC